MYAQMDSLHLLTTSTPSYHNPTKHQYLFEYDNKYPSVLSGKRPTTIRLFGLTMAAHSTMGFYDNT